MSLVCPDLDHHNNKNYVGICMQRGFLNCGRDCIAEAQPSEWPTRPKLPVSAELVFLGVILWNMGLHALGGPGGAGPDEAMEIFRGWNTSCGDKLRELGLFWLEKRRLWGDPGKPSNAKCGLIRKMGTDFLAVGMVKHWNRFPESFFSHFPLPCGVNGSLPTCGDECHLPKG